MVAGSCRASILSITACKLVPLPDINIVSLLDESIPLGNRSIDPTSFFYFPLWVWALRNYCRARGCGGMGYQISFVRLCLKMEQVSFGYLGFKIYLNLLLLRISNGLNEIALIYFTCKKVQPLGVPFSFILTRMPNCRILFRSELRLEVCLEKLGCERYIHTGFYACHLPCNPIMAMSCDPPWNAEPS